MIGIKVTGLVKTRRMFEKIGRKKLYDEITKEIGDIAFQKAKQLCPVDTGELLRSTKIKKTKDGFFLYATAKHAIYNEYGCYNLKFGPAKYKGQRPFLRPATHFATRFAPQIFGKKIHESVKL